MFDCSREGSFCGIGAYIFGDMLMGFQWLGKVLIIVGLVLVVVGALIWLFPKIPFIGKLPGDIYVEKENFRVYFPITTCIIISIIITLLFMLFKR